MVYKKRTVILLIVLAMVTGGIITQSIDSWSLPGGLVGELGRGDANHDSESIWEASGLSQEQINKIASTYYLIDQKFYKEIDPNKVVDGAINGMLSSLEDPYSVYMDEAQAEQFTETIIESSFSGIGAEVTMEDGKVTVISPIKNSPAEKAGIMAKDKVLSVNGESLEGLTLNEAVAKIRGPKGTQAKLEVQRAGSAETVQIIVVRDDIDVETVHAEMVEGNIGKIEIIRFSQDTAQEFGEELARLESQNMKGLIIDVRNNPGGILSTVVGLVEPFIESGKTIVQTENRDGSRHPEVSKGEGKNYPVVVITNEGSASASEILAAALQESAGSTVIGKTTYGKGTVQTTFDTSTKDGSNIKMTISKWLTPDGNFIHEEGIKPDIEVDQPEYFKVAPLPKDKVLKLDAVGNDVRNLQLMLEGLGFSPDRTDGYYSTQTELSVMAFQRLHELPVTGEVNEQTATMLEQEIIVQMTKPENDRQLNKAIEHLNNLVKK